MATIKIHAYANEDDGTTSCDYRGQGELHGQHKTLLENEFGPDVSTNDEIEQVIKDGPGWNCLTKEMLNKGLKPSGVLGGLLDGIEHNMGLRIGVFDH